MDSATNPATLLAAVQAASSQANTAAPAAAVPTIQPIDAPPATAALPAQPKDGKAVLAAQVAAVVVQQLEPLFNSLLTVSERNSSLLQTLSARAVMGGQAASKASAPRATRSGGGAAAPAANGSDVRDKVRNNMLYNRYMYMTSPAYREQIVTTAVAANADAGMTREAILAQFNVDSSCKGKEPGSEQRLSAEAKIVWGFLKKPQKEAVKAEFEAWKTTIAATGATAPLVTEDAAGSYAVPAAAAGGAAPPMTSDEITSLLGGADGDDPF